MARGRGARGRARGVSAVRPSAATPVTVAVVSWNTRALLLRCLDSLAADVAAGRAAVWVVDNDSSDGSAAAARERAPWAEVLALEENIGFGRAVNLVAQRTDGEWLACANADVALDPGTLDRLLAAGEEPRTGCLAPRLVLDGGATQHSCYPLPTLGFTVAFNLGLPGLVPGLGNRMCLEGRWDPDRERPVPWAIAAFLLLRRSAFTAVGGFDPAQWMYAEDLDLGWRLSRAGWRTVYVPGARVRHADGASTRQAFGRGRRERFTTATYRVIARRAGVRYARAAAVVNLAGAAARLAVLGPAALLSARRRPVVRELAAWLRAHAHGLRALGGPEAGE